MSVTSWVKQIGLQKSILYYPYKIDTISFFFFFFFFDLIVSLIASLKSLRSFQFSIIAKQTQSLKRIINGTEINHSQSFWSDCNETRKPNQLVCKQSLNHLAKLVKYFSSVMRTHTYVALCLCLNYITYGFRVHLHSKRVYRV